MPKRVSGWNPRQWLHEQGNLKRDPMEKAKYHNTAEKWPTWYDDDAIGLNDTENGISHGFKRDAPARKARKSIDQLLNYRTKRRK